MNTSATAANDIAISVTELSKVYQIYDRPEDRFKQFFHPYISRLTGRQFQNYYHDFSALKNVSFEVSKGETVGIVGRNGSGKSTLLQIICGTLHPSSGMVETYGQVAALLELGSGFNHDFTGRENVYMNASILGLTPDQIDAKFDSIAAFANIGEFIEQPVWSYSSGMLLRLAFAVQAMIDPEILIIDEALAVGDEKFQRKCFARLEQLKNNGTSILFVSHAVQQITELCERVLLLDNGECLVFGEPKDTVGFYQRLLYAPKEEQDRLIEGIRAQDEKCVEQEKTCSEKVYDSFPSNGNDEFDHGLVPETTTAYLPKGAKIDTFKIVNNQGREVNVLQSGEKYRFLMSGSFLSFANDVHFGIHMRTISGVVITGQRYPEIGQSLDAVHTGQEFELSFEFKVCLLPAVYFVGGGIWAEQGSDCLHRVLDALMFRVVSDRPGKSFGYCDLASNEAQLMLTEK